MTPVVTDPDERWQYNVTVVSTWLDDEWAKWFFRTFREKDYRPLRFSPRESVVSEIEDLYRFETEECRFQMKRGLANALATWEHDFHGRSTLRHLTWVAAKIRATETIPALVKILLMNRQAMKWGGAFFDAADTILSVLAGFAPDSRIEVAFNGLFYDPAVAPHFSSLLALGISVCNHDRFAEAFNRFEMLKAQIPGYFVDVDIMRQFNDRLSKKTLWDSMGRLSLSAHRYARSAGVAAGVFSLADLVGFDQEMTKNHDAPPLAFPETNNAGLYQEASERIRMTSDQMQGSQPTLLKAIVARVGAI